MQELTLAHALQEALFDLRLKATARNVLQEFIDIDVTSDDLVRILKENPAYKSLFERFVDQKTRKVKKEEDKKDGQEHQTPTHRLIALLGMIGSRNFLLSLREHKAIYGSFPLQPDGSLQDIKSNDYLNAALEFEEAFTRNKLPYVETIFAAGYYFDWIETLAKKKGTHKKNADVWKRLRGGCFRTALVTNALGSKVRGFSFHKFAAAAGACAAAGKALLFLIHGDAYDDFLEETKGWPVMARSLEERSRFGLASEEIAEIGIRFFGIFPQCARAVRFCREPYRLIGQDPHVLELAQVLSLSMAMSETWRLPNDERDPVLKEWVIPKGLPLKPKDLVEAMRMAMTAK